MARVAQGADIAPPIRAPGSEELIATVDVHMLPRHRRHLFERVHAPIIHGGHVVPSRDPRPQVMVDCRLRLRPAHPS